MCYCVIIKSINKNAVTLIQKSRSTKFKPEIQKTRTNRETGSATKS